MTHQSYYNRALKANDPRYARIFEKMGYGTRDMKSQDADEVSELRAEYESVVGKRPFMGWGADKLREKIAEAAEENA